MQLNIGIGALTIEKDGKRWKVSMKQITIPPYFWVTAITLTVIAIYLRTV